MNEVAENQKIWDRDAILELLDRNKAAVAKALWQLYQRQTASEQSAQSTNVVNGRGFNKRDAGILSDIAKKLPRYSFNLTERQVVLVRRKIRKYWRQLLEEIEAKGGVVRYKANTRKDEIADEPEVDAGELAMQQAEAEGDRQQTAAEELAKHKVRAAMEHPAYWGAY